MLDWFRHQFYNHTPMVHIYFFKCEWNKLVKGSLKHLHRFLNCSLTQHVSRSEVSGTAPLWWIQSHSFLTPLLASSPAPQPIPSLIFYSTLSPIRPSSRFSVALGTFRVASAQGFRLCCALCLECASWKATKLPHLLQVSAQISLSLQSLLWPRFVKPQPSSPALPAPRVPFRAFLFLPSLTPPGRMYTHSPSYCLTLPLEKKTNPPSNEEFCPHGSKR